jgi:hypothetical protein
VTVAALPSFGDHERSKTETAKALVAIQGRWRGAEIQIGLPCCKNPAEIQRMMRPHQVD